MAKTKTSRSIKTTRPKPVEPPVGEGTVLYDGAVECASCRKKTCPKAVLQANGTTVRIFDPAKPQNGSYTMSKEEWDTMVDSFRS